VTPVLSTGPRRPRALAVLVLGLLLVLMITALVGPDGEDVLGTSGSDGASSERQEAVEEAEEADDLPADTLLVWAGAHLGEGYAEAVLEHPQVGPSTLVRGDVLSLLETADADGETVDELPDGWHYPAEVLAADPATYDAVAGREVLGELQPDEVVLSETSAQVRRLGPGARLRFADDVVVTVAAVLPDDLVGVAEVLAHVDGPLEVTTHKYLLVSSGGGDEVAELLVDLATDEREPRVEHHGTTPTLRHANSVLPPAARKLHFGEFPIQNLEGRSVRAGQSWIDEHISVTSVPVIGRVQCHEALIEPLVAAMEELRERGAEHVIDTYDGCWVPRTSGTTGPLSSHAWGISIDFNAQANLYGAEPNQPEVLVEVMKEHGFLWGGDWHVPDAMHFELGHEHVARQ
jgi:hypothetical protein